MSVDTYGELKNKLTCFEVIDILKDNNNISLFDYEFNYFAGKNNGFVDFDYTLPNGKIEKRSLFVLENCQDEFNEEITSVIGNEYTHLSIGNSKNSTLIMKDLVRTLGGGVVIPNDCTPQDSEHFFQIC